ncbi:hypothetical protein FMUND_8872 [Fusarium mundagurra]|uniref:Uncharacterized protein n=1 Tax=Fusarium mundagurra TaxID=1567541 RepID=A0A8H6DCC3_9HYPO|nr:hypothetical protein FMUND_8872 [Fusarium mundagurra]
MKSLSTVAALCLLNGALADGKDMAPGCVLTETLPTATVGCHETATRPTINGQTGQGTPQFSNAPPVYVSESSAAHGAKFSNAPPVYFPESSTAHGATFSNAPPVYFPESSTTQGSPQFSNAPPVYFPESSTAHGAKFSNAPPVYFPESSTINGQHSQGTAKSTPESSNAPPVVVSGGSISTGHVNVEIIVASLLACFVPAFIALL